MNISEQQTKYLQTFITTYEDFPVKGISFKELSLLYTDSIAVEIIQNNFHKVLSEYKPDCVIGCDARGFILGTLIAQKMKLPFVLARKSGKLPGEVVSKKYGLEYGSSELQMHTHIISQYKSPVIADDVLATGGTVIAVTQMLKDLSIEVNSYAFISEIVELGARKRLHNECGIIDSQILSILKS